MDFQSPPSVIEALKRRADHGIFGYSAASDELLDTIVSMLEKDYGWRVEPDWILWLPGLVTGINVACRAVGDDGDEVITNVPAYPPFLSAPGHSQRNLVKVPLAKDSDQWTIDFDEIENAITLRTKLFILCNPHNPTGRVYTRSELETLCSICEIHDIIVCSDEIHCGLILDQDRTHLPTATLSDSIADRTIALMAPSKTYNLPGLGCSFAIISNDDLRRRFRKAMAGIVPHVNIMGLEAALAAYRNGGEWLAELLNYLRKNRDTVENAVEGIPGLTMSHVEATYLAWIDARGLGVENPMDFFEQAGVGLSDGAYFGSPGFVRLNFSCTRATLKEALLRMERAIVIQ